jgi:multidrug efflux pump subunit AcrA (membrane-fusion protein)
MDITRPDLKRRQTRRRWGAVLIVVFCLTIAGFAIARLKPASPTIERNAIWTDTVKRGPMVLQVHAIGTLTPREDRLRLIPAETEATVVRIRVLPGAAVTASTVLMDLTNPELQQELMDSQLQLKAARVEYHNLQAKLQSDLMTQRAGAAILLRLAPGASPFFSRIRRRQGNPAKATGLSSQPHSRRRSSLAAHALL